MTHEELIKDYLDTNPYLRDRWYVKNGTLYIKSQLDFYEMGIGGITELPNNLHIKEWLDIQGTQITKLPENLYIGDVLYCRRSDLVVLPDSIVFGYNTDIGSFNDGASLLMCEEVQIKLISKNENNFSIIKNPTEKVKKLHNLLWKL